MSEPVQQHYLPKAAYLKFFEVPNGPGSSGCTSGDRTPS